ncbi:MAG: hypothetical protein LBG81_04245 [Coriobacteriaceae bacterium]|jgi:hypothetical protein|nr:hypothetical protein [Coriobacteriaceae bacterium]
MNTRKDRRFHPSNNGDMLPGEGDDARLLMTDPLKERGKAPCAPQASCANDSPLAAKGGNRQGHHTTRKVAAYLNKSMFLSTLFFVVIYGLVLLGVSILVFYNTGGQEIRLGFSSEVAYDLAFFGASLIYLFVIGIIFPLILGYVFNYGVTRYQFSLALLCSGAIHCAGLTVLLALLAAALGHLDAFALISGLVSLYFSYLLGWVIALGFQLRHVLTAAGGIVMVVLLTTSASQNPLFGHAGLYLFPFMADPLINFVVVLALTAAMAVVLPALSRRIPLKST